MGRELAWADEEILKLARERFVPVVGDDWYQRRRQDDEGEFFRKVAARGPRGGRTTATNQGVYCLTADGEFLAYDHGDVPPARMLAMLEKGLRAWEALPESRRAPGAVKVGDPAKIDARFDRQPPRDGLIAKVHARVLDRVGGEAYADAECEVGDGASVDHLWIAREEAEAMIPKGNRLKVGAKSPMPDKLVHRIARFNLLDNTRGEPPMWDREAILSRKIELEVVELTDARIVFEARGEARMDNKAADPKKARGYDAEIYGLLEYDRAAKRWTRFDLLALGDHWFASDRGARPGKTPLGVAFRLVEKPAPEDLVPPQFIRDPGLYWDPSRY